MCTSNHFQVINVIETFSNVLTESVTSASWIHSPSWTIIRIWPQKITHWSFMWNFLNSFQRTNVIKSFNWRWKSSVKTEEWIFNDSGEWKIIEKLSKCFPNITVAVFSTTFVIKSIDLSDLSWLMISSQNNNSIFISDFEGNKKSDSLNTVMTLI